MSLYLFRHAEAFQIGEVDGLETDEARFLTPKGKKVTSQVCRGLKRLDVGCDILYHSPLVRAVETAEIVAAEMGCKEVREEIGLADDEAGEKFFLSLGKMDPDKDIYLVGHQPYLGEWTSRLVTGQITEQISVSKSGVVCLDLFPGTSPPKAQLRWLLRSKHLQLIGSE